MRQKGIALTSLLLIVAGVVIVGLLSGRINIRTDTSQPQPEPTPSPSAAPTISPSSRPSPTSAAKTRRTQTDQNKTTNVSENTTDTVATSTPTPIPAPTTQPTGDNTTSSFDPFKLPLPKLTTLPIPTEKNLVPLASSYGASSTYGPGYEAQKAFDGSTSSRWSAAKDNFYGQIWLEWTDPKIVTSISWTSLANKYGAPKNFRVECGEYIPAFGGPLNFSQLIGNYQESLWSNYAIKDPTTGKQVKARWCGIYILDTQNKTYAATLTEIQVKGY